MHIWLDYACIPQKNKTLQGLSIRSLALYAAISGRVPVIPSVAARSIKEDLSNGTHEERSRLSVYGGV